MKRAWIAATCIALAVVATDVRAQQAPPSAEQIATSIDDFYVHVTSLRQRFYLTQVSRVTGRTARSWGTMRVKKPGRVRFDFDVDARSSQSGEMTMLDREHAQMFAPGVGGAPGTLRELAAVDDSLAAPLGFLIGRGHVTDAYSVRSVAPPADFHPQEGTPYALALTPRRPTAAVETVLLCIAYVRSGVASVQRLTIVSHAHDRTRYDFGTAYVNGSSNVGDADFAFDPPAGTQRVTAR